ncbi:uncharacterized protein LOC127790625 [Diospyros lotus]|uniref:uncharacterized protein LOC127790625 n=1 Tax=Diospyros lotus TaxID=55363 RepID=UPI0022569848|nr:uncharacterized protein LOC127790625 [Diospyros lotus]
MDPPPNHPTATGHPDSAASSPPSHHNESLPLVPGAKLRLVCSYGGHIIPRPHDKALCYVGGDTRMVVMERSSSLADLSARLSHTLLDGRKFTLKYQLPTEDLDSLISVATDEDLQNMIEEYDRISLSPAEPKLSRLRLFLFFSKPETVVSMGSLLDDAKSETWFVDALNGAALIPRGLSDSAAMEGLLELDNGDVDAQNELADAKKRVKNGQEVMDTSSSFGSSSSTPSMANLPPITVRDEDAQMVGLHEHFSHLAAASGAVQKQDEELALLAGHPPLLSTVNIAATGASYSTAVPGELGSRILSDDERSDGGAPTGLRKPPLPLQVQKKTVDAYNLPSPDSRLGGGFNLPSPDSVASDSSIASLSSLSKHPVFQDPTHVTATNDTMSNILDPSPQTHIQQVQDPAYALPPQQTHQQFVHSTAHYVHHPAAAAQVPISSYYQMYAPSSQQQLHHQIDQQYYLLPVAQTQVNPAYNFPPQANIADATAVASSRPPLPPTSTMVAPSAVYKEAVPPIYPAKAAAPALLQVPGNQFQQQYVGVAQMHHPSQPTAAASAAGANYGVEYNAHPTHDQFYYAQHPAPPQYQTMTTTAAALFSQASAAQLLADNSSQQIRTSQPL